MNKKYLWGVFVCILLLLMPAGCADKPSPAISPDEWPVKVISISNVATTPVSPGGAYYSITVKNISKEPVIDLTIDLDTNSPFTDDPLNIDFDVDSAKPFLPDQSKQELFGIAGPASPGRQMTINVTLQSGKSYKYTQQVQLE